MLEARERTVLASRRCATRQAPCVQECRQAQGRGCQRRHSAVRLQGLRRAHVRPYREHQASVLRVRLHPHRALKGPGLGASRVRGIRLLDHRVRHAARANGRRPVAIEGAASGALRLPFAGLDGCNRHPRRQGVGVTCGSPSVAFPRSRRPRLPSPRGCARCKRGRSYR